MEWEDRIINESVEGRVIAKGGGEEGKREIIKGRKRGGEQEQEEIGGRKKRERGVGEWRRDEWENW